MDFAPGTASRARLCLGCGKIISGAEIRLTRGLGGLGLLGLRCPTEDCSAGPMEWVEPGGLKYPPIGPTVGAFADSIAPEARFACPHPGTPKTPASVPLIKPIAGNRRTSFCWTVNRKLPGRSTCHLDLAPSDNAIAQNTNALVIERVPSSPEIGRLENGQFVFWKERWVYHFASLRVAAPVTH
jgi:hypothetical protein